MLKNTNYIQLYPLMFCEIHYILLFDWNSLEIGQGLKLEMTAEYPRQSPSALGKLCFMMHASAYRHISFSFFF